MDEIEQDTHCYEDELKEVTDVIPVGKVVDRSNEVNNMNGVPVETDFGTVYGNNKGVVVPRNVAIRMLSCFGMNATK